MKNPNFEVQFITRLRDHVASRYPGLSFSVSRSVGQPDIVIENSRTREVIGIEVKGGNSDSPVPAATIAVLVELSAAMKDHPGYGRRCEIWLVSSAKVLPPWAGILAQENIQVISGDSVDAALDKLDRRLLALDAGG